VKAFELIAGILFCIALGAVFGYHEGSKTSWVRCPVVPGAKVLTTINDSGKNTCIYAEDKTVGMKTMKVSL